MVNISPIPPLLCSTPPPIDFDDEDDEYTATPPVLNDVDETEEDVNELRDAVIESDLPPINLYKHEMITNNVYMPQYTPPPLDDVDNKYTVTPLNAEVVDLTSSPVSSQLDQNAAVENLSSDFSNSTASIPNIELIKNELEKTSPEIEKQKVFQNLEMVTIEDVLEDDSETEVCDNKTDTERIENDMDFFEIKEIQPIEVSSELKENLSSTTPLPAYSSGEANENCLCSKEDTIIKDTIEQDDNLEEFKEEISQQKNVESEIPSIVSQQQTQLNHEDVTNSISTKAALRKSLDGLEDDVKCEIQKDLASLDAEPSCISQDEDGFKQQSKTNTDNSISNQQSNNSESCEIMKMNDVIENFGNFAEAFDNNQSEDMFAQTAEVEVEVKTNSCSAISDFAVFPTSFESNPISSQDNANSFQNSKTFQQFEEENDDDDFGDFNAAEPLPATIPTISNPIDLNQTKRNIFHRPTTEQLTKLIEQIFPLDSDESLPPPETDVNDTPLSELFPFKHDDIYLNSVEKPKALEFQWSSSNTRQVFLKALGIDSRQAMFGDHWNPLSETSSNPLKPIPMQIIPESITNSPSESIVIDCQLSNDSKKNLENQDLHLKPANTEVNKDNDEICKEIAAASADTRLHLSDNLEYGDKFSKTPPLSEMDSITSFNILPEEPSPSPSLDILPVVTSNMNVLTLSDFPINCSIKNSLSGDSTNDVVTTSTFAGPLKETHIYTPKKLPEDSKRDSPTNSNVSSSSSAKIPSIDFDYEKAAMGVIIDETVVKKEYRDIVYNPDLNFNTLSKDFDAEDDTKPTPPDSNKQPNDHNSLPQSGEFADDDEFTDFQYVGANTYQNANAVSHNKNVGKSTSGFANNTPLAANDGMILSPAILLPQAIPMSRPPQQKPQIEWGDDTVNINPDELARIEELYSKSSTATNHYKKEQERQQQTKAAENKTAYDQCRRHDCKPNDDDDWSDFVSVSVINNSTKHNNSNNNNPPEDHQPENRVKKVLAEKNYKDVNSCSNLDDEWSDFVCSTPLADAVVNHHNPLPQFNSSAWKNANFYNNPLSFYHKDSLNIHTPHNNNNNNNNTNNNNSSSGSSSSKTSNQMKSVPHHHQQQQEQHVPVQQIHIMQNFSTAPVAQPERLPAAVRSNQFLVGTAKVAPSIALIPDLGFVAPAISTHTSFINSLPKPNTLNMKK